MLLGWFLTSTFGPVDHDSADWDPGYDDVAAGAVLEDPTGFARLPAGIIGDSLPEDDPSQQGPDGTHRAPSVTDALAELHQAVKGKIQSWTPYGTRPGPPHIPGQTTNTTAELDSPPNKTGTGFLPGEHVLEGLQEDERLGARTRIGKCTILFYGNSFWERAIRTHERHNREHGYRLHVLRQQLLDDVWSKPAYILSLLLRELAKPESERLEWLMWVDADTVLLNPHIPIEVFLPPPGSQFEDVHLVYSNDWNGLNNGVFPVRVNTWAVELFSAIVAYRHYRPDDVLVYRDQSAMDTLMHEPRFAPHIIQAPQRWFNAYQGEHNETLAPFQIRRGDFLVHFAGVGNREERMGYWLERAEQHLEDWEVPLKSTSYPQEARDFWAEQSDLRKQREQELTMQRKTTHELLAKVEETLNAYGDRLGEEQRAAIDAPIEELKSLLDDGERSKNGDLLEEETKKLEEATAPLNAVVADAQKVLLKTAHEAIFAGEKDIFGESDAGGTPSVGVQSVADHLQALKELVMRPQEQWDRGQISAATNALTEARGRLQEQREATRQVLKQAEQERKQQAKEMTDLQVQVQAEAAMASDATAGAPMTLSGGNGGVVVVPGGVSVDAVMGTTSQPSAVPVG
jgi:hypothetical protein